MRWSNLLIIFRREVRDQIRDRRTLFMIFVLPILLYPILGIGVIQFAAALEQKPRIVVVVGAEYLPKAPPLLESERRRLQSRPLRLAGRGRAAGRAAGAGLGPLGRPGRSRAGDPRRRGVGGHGDPARPARAAPARARRSTSRSSTTASTSRARSRTCGSGSCWIAWQKSIVDGRLKRDRKTESYAEPIQVKAEDVATAQRGGGQRLEPALPVPAGHDVADRGVLPGGRPLRRREGAGDDGDPADQPGEPVRDRPGQVPDGDAGQRDDGAPQPGEHGADRAAAGAARSASLGGSPGPASRRPRCIAPPTLQAAFWMILLLIPLAAFFSAVCLALAVLARSMKEGQYYMTPLYLVCMPLIFLTLMPGDRAQPLLQPGPDHGGRPALEGLILGNYDVALRYFLPVLVPTLVYAAVALRWAIDQFQREDVLFREAEQFSLSAWFRHLFRDREPTPTGGQAAFCFALILTFVVVPDALPGASGADLSTLASVVAGQSIILIPPVMMAILLTSDPARTLRLAWPEPRYLLAGGRAGRGAQSAGQRAAADRRVALPDLVDRSRRRSASHGPGRRAWRPSIVVFALIPAICEEFAFRGFILSGLERQHRTRSAILLSALMFGFLHVLLEPVPAALQRDAPGDRPGPPGRAEPEHPAGDRLPLPEQCHGGRAGLPGAGPVGRVDRPLDLSQPGRRALSWALDRGERAPLGRACCSLCGSGSPSAPTGWPASGARARRAGVSDPRSVARSKPESTQG